MRKEYIPISFLTFVNTLNFTIMIPVLPFIVQQYGGGPIMYGLLLSMYPIFQFFSAPLLGTLSDRFGRRPILLISQAGTVLSWVIFAIAYFLPDIQILTVALPVLIIMLARIADGATGGNNSVANAYIADVTDPKERTKVYGSMGAVVGIALIAGPALGGLTSTFGIGFLGAALVALGVSVVTFFIMYLYLPESLSKEHRVTGVRFSISDELRFLPKIQKYVGDRRIKYLFFIRTFFLLVFSAHAAIMVLFMIDAFGLTQQQVGYFFLIVGMFLIFNQAVVVRFLSRYLGDLRTFLVGQIAIIAALFGMVFVPSLALYIPLVYCNNFGFSVSFPTYRSLITNSVNRKKQGEINGIDESIMAATSAVAPLGAGYLYAHFGSYTFGILSAILSFAFVVFVLRFKRK